MLYRADTTATGDPIMCQHALYSLRLSTRLGEGPSASHRLVTLRLDGWRLGTSTAAA